MKTKEIVKAIKETYILPAGYFPNRAFPKGRNTLDIMAEFYCQVENWLKSYPQDQGTEFYRNLKTIQAWIKEK